MKLPPGVPVLFKTVIALSLPSVALLTLNRPKALNALSTPLFKDLNHALLEADANKDVGAIVITGSEKAFAGETGGSSPHPPIMMLMLPPSSWG